MKDQQRSPQETRDQREDQKQEQEPHAQARGLRLPAQQWAQLLRRGDGMLELPAPLLEQLAEAVGNSSLVNLLRQGGGGDPVAYMPDTLFWEGPEPEANHIQTAPPDLFTIAGWPKRSGPWPWPSKPGGIRDRG